MADDYNPGVEHSQVKRQEMVNFAQGNLVQVNQTPSNERSSSPRRFGASLPELKNMEYTNHQYMEKGIPKFTHEIEKVSRKTDEKEEDDGK